MHIYILHKYGRYAWTCGEHERTLLFVTAAFDSRTNSTRRNAKNCFSFEEFVFLLGKTILVVIEREMTRRVQPVEWNNHSYASLVQSTKKVSLPNEIETNAAGWLRRSASSMARRTTAVPMAMIQDDVPNYFGSAMQSMCLAFFTLAYAEVPAPSIDSEVTGSLTRLSALVNRRCRFLGSIDVCARLPEVSHHSLDRSRIDGVVRILARIHSRLIPFRRQSSEIDQFRFGTNLFVISKMGLDNSCSDMRTDYLYFRCRFVVCHTDRAYCVIIQQSDGTASDGFVDRYFCRSHDWHRSSRR